MSLDKTLLLTLALLGTLLGGAAPALAQTSGMSGHGSMDTDTAPAGGSMMESMNKMNQAMSSAPMTGDPDHDFVVMMIPHHQGAIDMAKFELRHGREPELRKLARYVVAAQVKEIALMKRWLAQHPAK